MKRKLLPCAALASVAGLLCSPAAWPEPLEAALAGHYQPEQHFADLYHREPQLPPHLQALLTPDTPSS